MQSARVQWRISRRIECLCFTASAKLKVLVDAKVVNAKVVDARTGTVLTVHRHSGWMIQRDWPTMFVDHKFWLTIGSGALSATKVIITSSKWLTLCNPAGMRRMHIAEISIRIALHFLSSSGSAQSEVFCDNTMWKKRSPIQTFPYPNVRLPGRSTITSASF